MPWLVRDGEVLASVEVADSVRVRARGLLGRDGIDGAILLPGVRAVHTLGMRFAIDVAFIDGLSNVFEVVHMPPGRIGRPRLKARSVLEAQAGSFERWRLAPGDLLELHVADDEAV